MQKDPVISALVGALFLGSVAIFALGLSYESHFRQLRQLQPKLLESQKARSIGLALANESVEYRRQHNAPALDPILISVGINPNAATAPKK